MISSVRGVARMLDANKIHLGDCLELMKEIPDASVGMILCDLPYGTTNCKWDSVLPFKGLWEAYERISKADAGIVLFGSQPFTSALIMSNPSMFKYQWVWNKVKASGHLNAKLRPMLQHEDVAVFCKGKAKYFPQGLVVGNFNNSRPVKLTKKADTPYNKNTTHGVSAVGNYPKSIITFSKPNDRERIHPTQKPVDLCEYLIKTYTNPGELVLDNCAGSGTTAVACKQTGRRYLCIEKDRDYWLKACERVGQVNRTP